MSDELDEARKRLDAIKARLSKITPGSWREDVFEVWIVGKARQRTRSVATTKRGDYCGGIFIPYYQTDSIEQTYNDAVFIAHAPLDIAWLVHEMEQCLVLAMQRTWLSLPTPPTTSHDSSSRSSSGGNE